MEEVIETTLLRGKLKLLQPQNGLRASTDTVFLAAAIKPKAGQKVLDAGCGSGAAGLCVALRNPDIKLIGIDIQPAMVEIARRNAEINAMTDRCSFASADIRHPPDDLISDNSFDQIMINPPYMETGTHTQSQDGVRALALGEDASGATLQDWIKFAHRKLRSGGTVTLIHRADRLDDIVVQLSAKRWFGGLTIHPLWPRSGEDARRVFVSAIKDRHHPLRLEAGTILHNADGTYTAEAQAVLDDLAFLEKGNL